MGLNILGHQAKSVSPVLNDVFVVKIMWNQGEEYEELPSCVGFTPPSPKWKVELQSFGNNSCKFLIPDYDSIEDATIELLEYSDLRVSDKIAKMLSYVFDFNVDKWWYLEKNIHEIVVEVYDNTFSSIKYTYVFRYIKITKYNNYDLSYTDDSPVKWSISFNFMYYKQYAGVYQKDITAGVDTENYNYDYEKANNDTAAAAAEIAANEKAPDISSDLDKIGGMNSSNLDNDAAEKVNEEKAAEKKKKEEEAKQKNGEKSEGVGCKDPLDGILTGNSRAEYYDYLAKLKEADPSFDPEHSSYIYYDMATNTKYAIKDGKLVKTYTAYTATGDSAKKNGEAAEGVYQMYDVNAGSGVNSSKHAAKKQATEKAIAAAGLKVDDLEKEVASGKYKSMAAAMRAHGIDTSKITYTYKDGDGKTITNKMNETDFSYSSYSKYGNNMIDEGNNNGYRETTASGINSHVNYKENDEKVKAYEAKKAAGTNTAEDDKAIRDYLSSKSATQGCSVMSSQDTAWEKQFMEENGGKVYEIKGNGTSASNKHNDSKHPAPPEIGYSQAQCVANDVTTSAPADALSTSASTPNQIPQVENTTETSSTPPAEAVAPATPAPSNDQEFVFEDVEVKADPPAQATAPAAPAKPENNDQELVLDNVDIKADAEPPKTSGVDVSGMTAAAADEATKEQQAANVQDRANELVKKVHYGEIDSKGGWVGNAKKAGYTDEEIAEAKKQFNGNAEYKANWEQHKAQEAYNDAEDKALNSEIAAAEKEYDLKAKYSGKADIPTTSEMEDLQKVQSEFNKDNEKKAEAKERLDKANAEKEKNKGRASELPALQGDKASKNSDDQEFVFDDVEVKADEKPKAEEMKSGASDGHKETGGSDAADAAAKAKADAEAKAKKAEKEPKKEEKKVEAPKFDANDGKKKEEQPQEQKQVEKKEPGKVKSHSTDDTGNQKVVMDNGDIVFKNKKGDKYIMTSDGVVRENTLGVYTDVSKDVEMQSSVKIDGNTEQAVLYDTKNGEIVYKGKQKETAERKAERETAEKLYDEAAAKQKQAKEKSKKVSEATDASQLYKSKEDYEAAKKLVADKEKIADAKGEEAMGKLADKQRAKYEAMYDKKTGGDSSKKLQGKSKSEYSDWMFSKDAQQWSMTGAADDSKLRQQTYAQAKAASMATLNAEEEKIKKYEELTKQSASK